MSFFFEVVSDAVENVLLIVFDDSPHEGGKRGEIFGYLDRLRQGHKNMP